MLRVSEGGVTFVTKAKDHASTLFLHWLALSTPTNNCSNFLRSTANALNHPPLLPSSIHFPRICFPHYWYQSPLLSLFSENAPSAGTISSPLRSENWFPFETHHVNTVLFCMIHPYHQGRNRWTAGRYIDFKHPHQNQSVNLRAVVGWGAPVSPHRAVLC